MLFRSGDAAAQAEMWERFVAQSSDDSEPLETVRVLGTVRSMDESLDEDESADVPAARPVEPSEAVAVAGAPGHAELLNT